MPPPQPQQDPALAALLAKIDVSTIPRPWRNPNWKPSNRRNKNVKQILSELARKEAAAQQAAKAAADEAEEELDGHKTATEDGDVAMADGGVIDGRGSSNTSGLTGGGNNGSDLGPGEGPFFTTPSVTYSNVEAAPSMHPTSRRPYCDVTGLPAPYTDPKTGLRYHNKEVYAFISSFTQEAEQADRYLAARNANFTLK